MADSSGSVEVLHPAVAAFHKRDVNFRDILDDLPAAIYTTDIEGRLTYFNKACIAFSGRTPTLGNDLWCVTWKLFTPDGRPLPHSECPMAVALREGREVRDVEAIAERPDGSRINFKPYPTPIRDAAGNLIGAVNMLVDITEQKQAENRIKLMAREIDHRAKNLLAVTQALVSLTKGETVADYKRALGARLDALAKVNGLIAQARWERIDLRTLIEQELEAVGNATVRGETFFLTPAAAQAFAMMIHELATNAVKYGALSSEEGRLDVSWTTDSERTLMLRWVEQGGPPATEPTSTSTGTSVIRGAVKQLNGELFREWAPSGLSCTFICQRSSLEE